MVYLLRILAAQGALASVYTDPEDPEGFSAGFVEAVDGQHVLMCDLSPWGQIDGWRVRRNQDVIQVLAGEEYEQRLAMLLAYHKQHHRCLFYDFGAVGPPAQFPFRQRQQGAAVTAAEENSSFPFLHRKNPVWNRRFPLTVRTRLHRLIPPDSCSGYAG